MMKKLTLFLVIFLFVSSGYTQTQNKIDLSGLWRFQLDPISFGKTPGSELYLMKLSETCVLPGSSDESGKGVKNTASHIDRLSRKFEYSGMAWYQREVVIPESWSGKEITLSLERCHWETALYIDGKAVGVDERLCTPNRFIVTQYMTPGEHSITICVDNRLKYPMDNWNHGTTDHTQTLWNGIVGDISLNARNKTYIEDLNVYSDIKNSKIEAKFAILSDKSSEGTLLISVKENTGRNIAEITLPVKTDSGRTEISRVIDMGDNIKLWDEFNPNLYSIDAVLEIDGETDNKNTVFGMRSVESGAHNIVINGRNIHLRGILDCCVFPLTGYPSTDVNEWKKIFSTVKEYGMNHVRFHSWCPPKAAFVAADELGVYIQAELPMWIKDVGKYPARRDFFEKEMYAILKEYGNHPSFIMMCNGNENEGDFSVLEDLVIKAQKQDSRRLYSASTARTHVKSDQYFVSHVTDKGWITVYEGTPSTMWDRSKESDIDVPVIAHETGQRCMYPDFTEIKKYTGVLEPRNFTTFQKSLSENGMLHQAGDFLKATGAHTVLQYKEVNEALMRTHNSGGYQLLGLADFPGQGSAFVGILNAFWESKGLVTPEKYRESCAPTVLLARFPKRAYLNDETFSATVELYNYGDKKVTAKKLYWQLEREGGEILKKGTIPSNDIACGTTDSIGLVNIPLNGVSKAEKLTVKMILADTIRNEWNVWVYPKNREIKEEGYIYVSKWDESAKQMLKEGKSVLLIPETIVGKKTSFASHFWNPIMFKWGSMILGTLIDSQSGAFEQFPTNYYADWQWWDILNYGSAIDLTAQRNITPIIQSVDSYESNRKLGVAFEACVGNGKLFVLNVDIKTDIEKREATKQLLVSVKNYVGSDKFAPSAYLKEHELDAIFYDYTTDTGNNESEATRQLLNK